MRSASEASLAIIGPGHLGLPLAVGFGKRRPVIGLDINAGRIGALAAGHDRSRKVSREEPAKARHEYGRDLVAAPLPVGYDGNVLAVAIGGHGRAAPEAHGRKPLLAADESDLRL